jgi:hypothetical protein
MAEPFAGDSLMLHVVLKNLIIKFGCRKRCEKTNRFLHESLLKIWDFFHECEKFRLFTSGA